MAGNLQRIDTSVDDNGLAKDLFSHSVWISHQISELESKIRHEVSRESVILAPRRGDPRRGILGARGNLARAVRNARISESEHLATGRIYIDAKAAPYYRWVLGGSGPKVRHSRGPMVFPETRGGFFSFTWKFFRPLRGNPRQDFFGEAVVASKPFVEAQAEIFGRSAANIRRT